MDHVKEYKVPKDNDKVDDLTRELWQEGCAPTSKFGTEAALPGTSKQGGGSGSSPEILGSDDNADPPIPAGLLALKSLKSGASPSGEKRKHSGGGSKDLKKSKKSKKEKKSKKKKKKHGHKKEKRSRRDTSSGSSSSGSD